jgi:hypothetical protein
MFALRSHIEVGKVNPDIRVTSRHLKQPQKQVLAAAQNRAYSAKMRELCGYEAR